MTKQDFWNIMDRCRREDTEAYRSALEAETAALPPEELRLFRAYLGAYMNGAAECVWLDMACKVINGYVSDDTALYFALWVIAQGNTYLINALKDPDSLADLPYIPFGHAEFEMLMGVGFDEEDFEAPPSGEYGAFEEADGYAGEAGFAVPPQISAEIGAEIIYKNGGRYGGFESFEEAMAAIPQTLPRLISRAEREGFIWK
ncbi:DUF4240 domain-containing protein [Breznakiella homolactica]|uniref:DUF4240 domain-containing protein n=1 Tax=Breznakiella homolactica TaxID=2798577 RepID=A0A7T7XLY6_9SPIR|nr:DUF4240 domain-containing protein [Breznakiella homolactica]QQO08741.1 DUF4240 domain-containing protein [Breznakiella homolactica]